MRARGRPSKARASEKPSKRARMEEDTSEDESGMHKMLERLVDSDMYK